MIKFEWDPNKAKANLTKHKVSFDEAKSVLFDTQTLELGDPEHSLEEERLFAIGLSYRYRILAICCCRRDKDRTIRIISARKATKLERSRYIASI